MSAFGPVWPAYPVIADPAHPAWHLAPPAHWMNDPNGTFWHDGWYHVFYQHNPDGEAWDNMHWGHARSRDLVQWEHLPLALTPQHALGERHCFSGCTALDAGGTPRILYTSVPPEPTGQVTQVSAAPNDAALLRWTQAVTTPVLALATHDGPSFDRDWRDPYVFRAEGRTFLILGATLGTESVIPIYENPDGGLQHWSYRGILHRAPRADTSFFECPNLVRLGEKWLLLVSPCREVEWRSGTLDLATFTFRTERHGRVDESDTYYATQTIVDPTGRTLLVGWAQRFPKGRGWNGCLGVPRRIWLDATGDLCAEPIAELSALRGTVKNYPAQSLHAAPLTLALPGDHSHEIELSLERGPTAVVRIEVASVQVHLGPEGVRFNDRPVVTLSDNHSIRIRWLLDRSLLEIFVNQRAAYSRVVSFPSAPVAQFSAEGEARLLVGRAWPLRTAPPSMGFQPTAS